MSLFVFQNKNVLFFILRALILITFWRENDIAVTNVNCSLPLRRVAASALKFFYSLPVPILLEIRSHLFSSLLVQVFHSFGKLFNGLFVRARTCYNIGHEVFKH